MPGLWLVCGGLSSSPIYFGAVILGAITSQSVVIDVARVSSSFCPTRVIRFYHIPEKEL